MNFALILLVCVAGAPSKDVVTSVATQNESVQIAKIEDRTFYRHIYGEKEFGTWKETRSMNQREWTNLNEVQQKYLQQKGLRNIQTSVDVSSEDLQKLHSNILDKNAAEIGLKLDVQDKWRNPCGLTEEEYILRKAVLKNPKTSSITYKLVRDGFYNTMERSYSIEMAVPPFKLTVAGQKTWNNMLQKMKKKHNQIKEVPFEHSKLSKMIEENQ